VLQHRVGRDVAGTAFDRRTPGPKLVGRGLLLGARPAATSRLRRLVVPSRRIVGRGLVVVAAEQPVEILGVLIALVDDE
jgi:hypothetical protein